jgi:GT2 family glycosyltransferase
MKTAIVILNYNGKSFLEKFLHLLIRYTPDKDIQIFIADNNSSDNSIPFLKENYPHLPVILLEDNYGFAGGYNKALEQIKAPYYVLLNSDIAVTENWLTPLINYMDNNPDVGACQPKIKSFSQPDYFEYSGAAGGYIDKYGYPFCRGRIFKHIEKDLGQYDSVADIFWASGACFLIRSETFWEVGGFDADFFAHMEEIDLCWRILSIQKRIVCNPQSTVYHIGGGTLSTENPYKTYLNFRNNLLMLYKNATKRELKKIFFTRWFLDYIAAFSMLLEGKATNAKSIIKARKDFRKMRTSFKTKRENCQRIQKINNLQKLILPQSLLWLYFINRKTKFSDLYQK